MNSHVLDKIFFCIQNFIREFGKSLNLVFEICFNTYKILEFLVCKNWKIVSRKSWCHLKSLNVSKEIREIKNSTFNWDNKDSLIILENILERCGRFVSEINFELLRVCDYYKRTLRKIKNIIFKKCSNIQVIEIGNQFITRKRDILVLKPIFNKLKKCHFSIVGDDISDADLQDLFSLNTKMEHCRIYFSVNISANVLYSLPCETIKSLEILSSAPYVPLHTVCRVSKSFCDFQLFDFFHFKFKFKSTLNSTINIHINFWYIKIGS